VCDVKYTENAGGNNTKEEKAVPLSRLTVKINAWHAAQLGEDGGGTCVSKRQRQETTNFVPAQIKQQTKEPKPLKDILSVACQSGKAKGWRAREMGLSKRNDVNFRECFRRDLAELKGFVSAVPDASKHNNRGREGTWKARTQQFNPHTIKKTTLTKPWL
jgi:hypothetical protein